MTARIQAWSSSPFREKAGGEHAAQAMVGRIHKMHGERLALAAPSRPVMAHIHRFNNSAFSVEIIPASYQVSFSCAIANHL